MVSKRDLQYHKDLVYLAGGKPSWKDRNSLSDYFLNFMLFPVFYVAQMRRTPEEARSEAKKIQERIRDCIQSQPLSSEEIRIVSTPESLLKPAQKGMNLLR